MKIYIYKILIAILLAISLSLAYLYMPQSFFSLDNRLRDFLFIIRGELPKNNQVVIVDIDEKALKEHGQWPWQRDLVSELLYNLSDAGAGIIGLDIVFAEEDRTSPHRFKKKFPELSDELENYDEILAATLSQTPVIGGFIFTFDENDEENTPMIPAIFLEKGMTKDTILQPKGIVLNIETLQDAMYSSGFFNNTPDEGGMIRSIPLLMKYDGVLYPSLVLEMIRIYSGVTKVEVFGDDAGASNVVFGEYNVPLDKVGRLSVNFRGKGKYFKHVSAADILSGDFNSTDIENKFVIIGTSAVGLFDLRSIPFDSAIAGVEVHANAIDNILQGDFLRKPAEIVVYDLMIIWGTIFLFTILFAIIRSWFIIPIAVVSIYGFYELYYWLLFGEGILINILFPLMAYSLTLVVSVGIDYIVVSGQKEEVKRVLGKKVSPEVMDYLLKHSSDELTKSKEVEVSILFSDIRSFTAISEKVGSPDKLIKMLNEYMTPMVDNIVEHKGTIDKFIGDAVMAYWNAPVKVENHADKAVQSAIEQIEKLQEINTFIKPKYDVEIMIGIGIHTGNVTAGDMGSVGRSDYTIIGDNVNLASRLEGLTKLYNAQILISNATFQELVGEYRIRPIDFVEVKGRHKVVEIYEVLCSNKLIPDEELDLYAKALKLFRSAELNKAYDIFLRLENENPSKLYEFYIARCLDYIENPNKEFSPVFKMRRK
ncbi:CHASE2 domain-containing protein [Sulfurimonas aquatica]|uniref:CHASE2 domain-containing protein n=1 Tax=Sulfurimonas aquatica TaxID=2672570 RepID=A0A975GDN0_9BACT|nr:adenylate/guanylate cyclase domain-containing protein [Sulfurimonas aquatica]QSZ42757.1 CHASE2 domain-containing protein [Sulfurimonas aquatica]